MTQAKPVLRCHIPWQEMNIDADGNVTPCCNWRSHNMTENPYCGNINTETIEEIWNSKVYQNLRRHMATGGLEKAGCAKCMLMVQGENSPFRYDKDVQKEIAETPAEKLSPYAANIKQLEHEIATGAEVMEATPTVISVTPSYACNIRCVHCYQEPSRAKDLDHPSLFDQISALTPKLSHIQCGGGEPLLLPIWQDFLKTIDLEENPYLTFATCTNATLVTDAVVSKLKSFKHVQIGVSMDAGTKEVYEKVRVGAKFDMVDANIDRLIGIASAKPESYVWISMSVMRGNIEDMANFFRFATGKGSFAALSPVTAMPADQAITCVNDPRADLPRWRAALENAEHALREIELDKVIQTQRKNQEWWSKCDVSWLIRNYMGQIEFVRAQIPWYLEHEAHISVEGDVPLELLDQDKLRAKRNDESILILSPADVSETTPRYFSKVEEGRFAVVIAPGMYRMGVIPRFGWPRYESNWLVTVSDNGFVSFEHYLARGGPGTFGMPISSGDAQYYDRVNAFQENTNTWVSSHAGNEVSHRAYLGMDFGSGHLPKLKEIRIQWAFDYCTPTAIAVQSSDQGQVWSTEAEYTVDVSDPARSFWWQTLELPHRKGRPLWRILALTPTKGEGGSMAVSQLQFLNA